MSDGTADESRFAESSRLSHPRMRGTTLVLLPFLFLRERFKSSRTHSNRVSARHSAHAPMAHLHGTIERGWSRSCGLPAELQDSYLGERSVISRGVDPDG